MDKQEKYSSLHDDLQFPYEDKNHTEYDSEKGYPHRLSGVGEKGEHSVIQRFRQFGVSAEDLHQVGITNPMEMTQEQYVRIVSEAVRRQYDTVFGSVFIHWSETKDGRDQFEAIQRIARGYGRWGLNLVRKFSDAKTDKTNLVIALEGADFVRDLGDIQKAYDLGIRSINLQYNSPNALATAEGLTDLGRQALIEMFKKGIVVDLAHANQHARKDILEMAEIEGRGSLVAYTHGAMSEDIVRDFQFSSVAESRGITLDEFKRIVRMKGVVGLGATRPFFQSIEHLAERIDQLIQIENAPNSLGLGTDLGGVAPMWTVGIEKIGDLYKLGDVLSERFGMPDATIKNIVRNNVSNWVKETIGK